MVSGGLTMPRSVGVGGPTGKTRPVVPMAADAVTSAATTARTRANLRLRIGLHPPEPAATGVVLPTVAEVGDPEIAVLEAAVGGQGVVVEVQEVEHLACVGRHHGHAVRRDG